MYSQDKVIIFDLDKKESGLHRKLSETSIQSSKIKGPEFIKQSNKKSKALTRQLTKKENLIFNETFHHSNGETKQKKSPNVTANSGRIHFNMQRLEEQMKEHEPPSDQKTTEDGVNHYALLSPINGGPFRRTKPQELEPELVVEETEEIPHDYPKEHYESPNIPSQDTFGVQDQTSQRMELSNTQSSFNLPKSKTTFTRFSKKQKDQATQMSQKFLEAQTSRDKDPLDYFTSKYNIDKRKAVKNFKKKLNFQEKPAREADVRSIEKPRMKSPIKQKWAGEEKKKKHVSGAKSAKTINFGALLATQTQKKKKKINLIDDKVLSICEKYSQRDISVESESKPASKKSQGFKLKGDFYGAREANNFKNLYLENPYDSGKVPSEEKMRRKYSTSRPKKNYEESEKKGYFRCKSPLNQQPSKRIKNEIYDCYYNQEKARAERSKSPLRNNLLNFKSSFAAIDPKRDKKHDLLPKSIIKLQDKVPLRPRNYLESPAFTSRSPVRRGRRSQFNAKSPLSPDPLCTPKKQSTKYTNILQTKPGAVNQNQLTPKSYNNGFSMQRSPGEEYIKKFGRTINGRDMRITFKQASQTSVKKQLKEYMKKEEAKMQQNLKRRNGSRPKDATSGGPWSVQEKGNCDSKGRFKLDRRSRPGTNELIGEYDMLINKVIKGSEIYKKKRILEEQLKNFEEYKKNIESLLNDINK